MKISLNYKKQQLLLVLESANDVGLISLVCNSCLLAIELNNEMQLKGTIRSDASLRSLVADTTQTWQRTYISFTVTTLTNLEL